MTHTVSLLCWLSTGLKEVLMLITTDSSTTLLSALLSDGFTTMFHKQHSDSAAPWLWVWLRQLISSWISSPLTQSAWLGCTALQLLSTNSARICWAATLVTKQGCWVWLPLLWHGLLPPAQHGSNFHWWEFSQSNFHWWGSSCRFLGFLDR